MLQHKIKPKPGQESVWDYPRPPRLEPTDVHIKIIFNNTLVAETSSAFRILETSHPPVYYLPPEDVVKKYLVKSPGASFCEWKGVAQYYTINVNDKVAPRSAWYYANPVKQFSSLKNYIAYYAEPMDSCFVNGEKVIPQAGGFYGGWITSNIVGPFKGDPGTMFW